MCDSLLRIYTPTLLTCTYNITTPNNTHKDDELQFGADYGFRNVSAFSLSKHGDQGGSDPLAKAIPGPAWRLARWNVAREYQAIRRSVRFDGFRGGVSAAAASGDDETMAELVNPLQEIRCGVLIDVT